MNTPRDEVGRELSILLCEMRDMGSSIENSVSDWQQKFLAKGDYNREAIHTAMENVLHDFEAYEESFYEIKDMVQNYEPEDLT